MTDYKQVYKNTGLVSRSLSEANKDATYASPITHPHNHELQDALEFFGGLISVLIYVALSATLAVGILVFLGVVVFK